MTVSSINSVNNYYAKTNVIPTAGSKKLHSSSNVNFSSHEGGHERESENNHWFLKLLLVCVAGFAGYKIFKNPVRKLLNEVVIEKHFQELFKKTEKKETYNWSEAEAHMKSLGKNNKDIESGFIYRLNDALKKKYGITAKEALAFGYVKKGDGIIASQTVICDKLDDALTKKFDGKNYIPFS